MSLPDRVVFDAEPLIAHADGEPGCEAVEAYLDAVSAGDIAGYASYVNFTEVRYILSRKYDHITADEYLYWLHDLGVETIDVTDLWIEASDYVIEYNPALGDSFALATAEHVDGTLLIGGDDDYDEISDPSIEHFRQDSV